MCAEGLSEGELGELSWEGTVTLSEVGGGRLPPRRSMGVAEHRLRPGSGFQSAASACGPSGWIQALRSGAVKTPPGRLKPRIGTAPGKILALRFLSEGRPPPLPPPSSRLLPEILFLYLTTSATPRLVFGSFRKGNGRVS